MQYQVSKKSGTKLANPIEGHAYGAWVRFRYQITNYTWTTLYLGLWFRLFNIGIDYVSIYKYF